MNWKFWRLGPRKKKLTLECQWSNFKKKTHLEKEWASIKCAACPHIGREHRNITIERKDPFGKHLRYDTNWSCKKCNCKHYYREDMHSLVTCKDCGVKYFASGAGNPDGVAFCPNGHLDDPFEPYCPTADGGQVTPEEWDRTHGD